MIRKKWNPAAAMVVQALLIYVWLTDLSALAGTDTYYSVYLLCGAAALLCLWDNRKGGKTTRPCGYSRGCSPSPRHWATTKSTNQLPCRTG